MPENPLLPNRKLQQLYAAMLRARALAARPIGLEAIFATLAEQLEPGDVVITSAQPSPLTELLQPSKRKPQARVMNSPISPLAFAAGVAAVTRLAGGDRLVTALLDTRKPETEWAALLDYAQRDRLPLVLICPEISSARSAKANTPLTWQALSRVVKKLAFPVLTVDGADAVAMYRAMQESVLRARHGDGPALLWCLMPPPGRSKELSPVQRLERYMEARSIARPRA